MSNAILRAVQRCLALFRKSTLDTDFDEEARSHIALATDDYVQRGMPLVEAQRLARLKFGSLAASKDAHRDSRGLAWLDGVLFDIRLAFRMLRRDRVYTTTAVVMLTVALGLNATVFTVMDGMLFRGFPQVRRNDRIAYIQERCGGANCGVSYADFEVWRAEAQSFEALAFLGTRVVAVRDVDGRIADLTTRTVSANTFRLLGVSPLLGRDFVDADEADGAPQTALISHRLWRVRYASQPGMIGSTFQVNGSPTVIIGVMPEGFDFTSETSMWMPVVRTKDLAKRGNTAGSHVVVGRLRDGVSMRAGAAELESINQRIAMAYPDTNDRRVPIVFNHAQFISGPEASMIWGSLWAGSWFVLVIACANLANLTLVRTIGRWRQFVTTLALGAGRARVIRQIAIESLLLTSVAAPLGWAITTFAIRAWSRVTASPHQVVDYTVDSRTLAYLLAVASTATLLFSAGPILRARQLSVISALKSDARGVTQSPWSRHLSFALVAVQMTLAIVLLSGAGILIRSLHNISDANTGLRDPEHVLVGMLRMPSLKYPDTSQRLDYLKRMESELRKVPGIETVSLSAAIPTKSGGRRSAEIESRPADPVAPILATSVTAGPEYFQVLDERPLAGREFNEADRDGATPVAIVNEKFATDFWPGESPVGRRLRFIDGGATGRWLTVVGVVHTILEGDTLRQHFAPVVYTPFNQETPARAVVFVARASVAASLVAPLVRSQLQQVDGDVLLEQFTTLKQSFAFSRDSMDFEHSELGKHAAVAPIFAGIALLLSAVGLVAVLAHSVSQRIKEIGIRMALGAATRDISRMVLREGMVPVAFGLGTGMAASIAANHVLRTQLVGVSPYDPLTLIAGPLLLIVVAMIGCGVPAWQATRVEPVVALRSD